MTRRHLRALLLVTLPALVVAGACSERLDTAAPCPLLCPGQQLDVLDAVLDPAVVLDTTLGAYPFIGSEVPLVIASRGDTLDLRVVVRFDSLVRDWTPVGDTLQAVLYADSSFLSILVRKSTVVPLPTDFSVEAYDVTDLAADDTIPTLLLPRFVAGNLLGRLDLTDTTFVDSAFMKVPLDSAKLLAIIMDPDRKLRIGVRITSADPVEVFIAATATGVSGPLLQFRPAPDSGTRTISVAPSSSTPINPPFFSNDFVDYLLIADAPDIRAAGRFAIGGLPGNRTLLQFDLPRWLTDSVFVLRARLELTQDPVYGLGEGDTVRVRGFLGLAGPALTDLHRVATIFSEDVPFLTDSIVRTPADSGAVTLEIHPAIRQWHTVDGEPPFPTRIILRMDNEGVSPLGLRFFDRNSAPALRPRLRVSYVPNVTFGRP